MEKVEAGLLDTAKKLLGGLFKGFDALLRWLTTESTMDIKDWEETESGGAKVTVDIKSEEDDTIIVSGELNIEKVPDSESVKVTFTDSDGKKHDVGTCANDQEVMRKFDKFLEEKYLAPGVSDKPPTSSSKSLKVTLQKVIGNDSTEVQLLAITANYDPREAQVTFDTALENQDFIELISEESNSFEIIDDGSDELDVTPIDDVETDAVIYNLLESAITLYNNLKVVHWNVRGENFSELHELLEEYLEVVGEQVDYLGELCIELHGLAPNPGSFNKGLLGSEEFTGYETVQIQLELYIATLELLYCNFTPDVQDELLDYIRFWKKENRYKIGQRTK